MHINDLEYRNMGMNGNQIAVGSGSDPNSGDTLSYQWTRVGGTSVTINNDTTAQANFMAPDVVRNLPQTLTFRLTVTDQGGLSANDEVSVTVMEPGPIVTISGTLQYEAPPHNPQCDGLNFNAPDIKPIRGATVQLMDGVTQSMLQTTTSACTASILPANLTNCRLNSG